MNENPATLRRVYNMTVASVYPLLVAKVTRKDRTKDEVDQIIRWLTGYSQSALEAELAKETTYEDFFNQAPKLNPDRSLITGVICGVRIEEIKDPIMKEVRYLDKLIDELAKGRPMTKIMRQL